MDDPAYAKKYSGPYSSNDFEKISRMAKQSVDARFTAGRSGGYVGLGLFGAEIGALTIPTENTEAHLGLRGLLGPDAVTGGLDTGFRVHIPSRMTPFVGAGAYIGGGERNTDDDGIDNDNDGFTDESGEHEDEFLMSFYPEVGVHFWNNGRSRLSLVGQYHWTPDGGVDDFAYLGLQFTLLQSPSEWHANDSSDDPATKDEQQFVSAASFVSEHLLPDEISKHVESPSKEPKDSTASGDDDVTED